MYHNEIEKKEEGMDPGDGGNPRQKNEQKSQDHSYAGGLETGESYQIETRGWRSPRRCFNEKVK